MNKQDIHDYGKKYEWAMRHFLSLDLSERNENLSSNS